MNDSSCLLVRPLKNWAIHTASIAMLVFAVLSPFVIGIEIFFIAQSLFPSLDLSTEAGLTEAMNQASMILNDLARQDISSFMALSNHSDLTPDMMFHVLFVSFLCCIVPFSFAIIWGVILGFMSIYKIWTVLNARRQEYKPQGFLPSAVLVIVSFFIPFIGIVAPFYAFCGASYYTKRLGKSRGVPFKGVALWIIDVGTFVFVLPGILNLFMSSTMINMVDYLFYIPICFVISVVYMWYFMIGVNRFILWEAETRPVVDDVDKVDKC